MCTADWNQQLAEISGRRLVSDQPQSEILSGTSKPCAVASVHTLPLHKTSHGKQNPNISMCSHFTGGCHGDHCSGRLGHLPVMLPQGVEQGPLVLQTRRHRLASEGISLVNTCRSFTLDLRRRRWQRFYPATWWRRRTKGLSRSAVQYKLQRCNPPQVADCGNNRKSATSVCVCVCTCYPETSSSPSEEKAQDRTGADWLVRV